MDSDVIMVTGIVILMLSIPAALSAFVDQRRPWVSAFVVLVGAGIFAWGWVHHPEDMTLDELPHVVIRVLARIIP